MKVDGELIISHGIFLIRPCFDGDESYETFSLNFRLEFLNDRVKEEFIAQSASNHRREFLHLLWTMAQQPET